MTTLTNTPWRARAATLFPTFLQIGFFGLFAALVALHVEG